MSESSFTSCTRFIALRDERRTNRFSSGLRCDASITAERDPQPKGRQGGCSATVR